MNELNLDFNKPLVLVEGFFDMLKSVDNTTPLGSNDLSERSLLFDKIIKSKTEVVIALDSDAKKRSFEIADKLMRNGINTYFVDLAPYKDPGTMTKEEFVMRFNSAKPITETSILLARMN